MLKCGDDPSLSLQEAASLTAGASMWTTLALPDKNVPSVRMADGPMGIASGRIDERDTGMLTPCPMALGASWDGDLVERIGAAVGQEAARMGVDLVLAPNVNLARSPLAGRSFEYFSEDPLLTGMLASAWVTGLQSTGTGAVVKHLVCNDSETDRDQVNIIVDERTLREIYLLPFELTADAGCAGMLTAYNRLNGSWCSEQKDVISQIVKGEWRYPGVVMSDWFGTRSLGALHGGLDLEMPGPARFLGSAAAKAVEAGELQADRLQDAACRVARAARAWSGPKVSRFTREQLSDLLVEAAAAGFTLLKNRGRLLPLDPSSVHSVAVIGPNATAPCYQGGTFAKVPLAPDVLSPLEAIRKRYGQDCTIVHEPGVAPSLRLPTMPVMPSGDFGDEAARGMAVEYFECGEPPLPPHAREIRDTNSLTWFAGASDQIHWDRPGIVRASGVFTPRSSGMHHFHIGGTGALRLSIDGRQVYRRDGVIPSSDIMGVLKSGDADAVAVELAAGVPVAVVAELHHQPARAQGLWYGIRPPEDAEQMFARAVEAAAGADAVILIVGESSDAGVESKDRDTTELPREQIKLIEAVCAANPRTAVIANVGHAFDTSWDGVVGALLLSWYPGQEFGRALAEVLAGDREPGGRLPVSIARREEDYPAFRTEPAHDGSLHYAEAVRLGYRGFAAAAKTPRHAFGAGMGYADFDIGDASVMVDEAGGAEISALVRNISDRAGTEILQAYREDPELTLIGFAKVALAPGESQYVSIAMPPRRFMCWDDGWRPIGREIAMSLGRSATDRPFRFIIDMPDTMA